MSACQGCGAPIPPSRGGPPRKWCSDRCRKGQYAGACVDCGARTNGYAGPGQASERCVTCSGVRTAEMERARWFEHRVMIEAMWADGKTAREIGDLLGWETRNPNALIVILRRQHGYDLPHRRTPEQIIRITTGSDEHMAKARAAYRRQRKAAA